MEHDTRSRAGSAAPAAAHHREVGGDDGGAGAPVQLMAGQNGAATSLSALMTAGGNLGMVQLREEAGGARPVQHQQGPVPTPQPTKYVSPEEVAKQAAATRTKPNAKAQSAPGVTCATIPLVVPPIVNIVYIGAAFIERELAIGGSLSLKHTPKNAGPVAATAKTGDGGGASVSGGGVAVDANRAGKVNVSADVLNGYAKQAIGDLQVKADIAEIIKSGKGSASVSWGKAIPGGTMKLEASAGSIKGTIERQVDVDLGGGYSISGTVSASLTLRVHPAPNAPATSFAASVAKLAADHKAELIAAGVIIALIVCVAAAPAVIPAAAAAAATVAPVAMRATLAIAR